MLLVPGDASLTHFPSQKDSSVLQRQGGMIGSIVDSALSFPTPIPDSPKLAFPTHHQDPIGDHFRCRHLTAKDKGLMGHLAPCQTAATLIM